MSTDENTPTRFVPIDHPLGSRISLRGGGGKTTLGRTLAAKTGLRHIEIDAIQHLPNWVERPLDEFRQEVQKALQQAESGWIADGNYTGKLTDLVLAQADMVIFLNLPWRVMFWRSLTRSISRARDKRALCGDNYETWRRLVSRDALWVILIKTRKLYNTRRERLLPLIPANVPVIELKSRKELDEFYRVHDLVRER